MLLRYLNIIGVSVEDFFNTKVPDWFINKLIDFLEIDYSQLCYSGRESERPKTLNIEESPKKGHVLKATVESVTDAARHLLDNNLPITYKNIEELAGIKVRSIKKRPDLIMAIKEIKNG